MYFISKGDCFVNARNQKGEEQQATAMLVAGDHFGEISLIYRCKRSATVISRNYNSLARLQFAHWREIISEFPSYYEHLRCWVYSYQDERKRFVMKMLEAIPVFKGLKSRIINHLIYSNEPVAYPEGSTILKSFDQCNSIMLLECGELEVYTEFDSHEFVLEKLHPGTVINYREYMI
jgi:CRP-like cAMP-binding protein